MHEHQMMMGSGTLKFPAEGVEGGFVTINNERFYRISNYDLMPDFFMTIVSDSNHWMFLSSNGSLSAGRQDRDNAIFPYYTDDKIHDYHGLTGSQTIIQCHKDRAVYLWEPFSKALHGLYDIERNIYKSVYGNKIIFEEVNKDLGLRFEYGWYNTDAYGFVKHSRLTSTSEEPVQVTVLDGVSNLLPSEVDYDFQNEYSNLLDGYKKSELLTDTGLGLFMLSAIPIDRAEPSESLRANTVWSKGLAADAILLSNKQLDSFRHGIPVSTETDVKGTRGAYYVVASLTLEAGKNRDWMIVADLNKTSTDVNNLNHWLANEQELMRHVAEDITLGTQRLKAIVASADGIQATDEELTSARHFSNTLFNIMRGGIYLDNYQVKKHDFVGFVQQTNSPVGQNFDAFLSNLPELIDGGELLSLCLDTHNPDLIRICYEYLPLTFSRRHGDPSRPWNLFSIITKNDDGTRVSDYQGNWRDIFQNWEALCMSFPGFIENIICKFLNASTADGYNPYRIMKGGIDWERPDPDDPWAYIGYWGDHQIIYLQKLLEVSDHFHPEQLNDLLVRDIFAYANVPYRIKGYDDVVIDPQNTIDFDTGLQTEIEALVDQVGADGRLIQVQRGGVYHVNMTEKVLVTALVKLSNFIPEAGIWMNTQRPEWNDANNALVGNGVSVVTLCYLRRFLDFWRLKFLALGDVNIPLSKEVVEFFDALNSIFNEHAGLLEGQFSDQQRRQLTDELGKAGSDYRLNIYANSFSGLKETRSATDLVRFLTMTMQYAEHCIRANQRDDGLYHAYNLISFSEDNLSVRYLYEMLEGQVAVLSSGYLNAEQSLVVLDNMKSSRLFRENQYSYLLYPDRELPRFTEKNVIPTTDVEGSALLSQLVTDNNNKILRRDDAGHYHFSSEFHNAEYLAKALEDLDAERYGELVNQNKSQILDIYEAMFDHQSFTGRSGTFYAYEGLGSIYWHMVSKLLLAVNETFVRALEEGTSWELLGRLKDHYYEIKAGIGLFKSPDVYGAFPTDAYSHTVRDAGVKQPGMTGQVKEDVLSRFSEVGVRIQTGVIYFDLRLLNLNEFLSESKTFEFIDLQGLPQMIALEASQMAYSFCQVPIIYRAGEQESIELTYADGQKETLTGNSLNEQYSRMIFDRTGKIARIDVNVVL